tara:strand:- start:2221 stop:3639 length:1419 start_codon:yes stop_codon:yes gene_type:complete
MNPHIYKKARRSGEAQNVTLLILLLSGLSWFATSDGFIRMLSNGTEVEMPVVAAAYVLSACVVMTGLLSISAYFKRQKPVFVLGFIVSFIVSVTMGMSFYSDKLGLVDDHIEQQTQQAANKIFNTLNPQIDNIEYALAMLDNLNTYSSEQAMLEATDEQGGCYTRCNYRKENVQQIALLLSTFSKKVQSIKATVHAVRTASDINEKQSLIEQLNGQMSYLSNNPSLNLMKFELMAMIKSWETGIKTTYDADHHQFVPGKKLYKTDGMFVSVGNSALNALNSIETKAIEINILGGDNASLKRSIEIILDLLAGNFGKLKNTDWFALAISVIVDLGILYLTFVKSEITWTATRVKKAQRESEFGLTQIRNLLKFTQLQSGRELALMLEAHARETHSEVVITTNGQSVALELLCIKLEGMGVFSKYIQGYVDRMLGHLMGKQSFKKLYKVPRNAFNELKLAAVQYDCEYAEATSR